jgi:DNA modification methylase
VPGQFGLEATPDLYVASMVAVFREVWRVLRDDGVVFLNLGDSYFTNWGSVRAGGGGGFKDVGRERRKDGAKLAKQLVGIPWRVAFALQADGWYLRSDIIWAKPNPMPESVTDRPTKSHEYVFLLTKAARYYWDAEAVKEPSSEVGTVNSFGNKNADARRVESLTGNMKPGVKYETKPTRNIRSVWSIATQPYLEAHFATMPEKLVEPCIKAGSRPAGKRCDCEQIIASPTGTGEIDDPTMETGRAGMNRPRRPDEGTRPVTRRRQREWARQIINSPHSGEMEREAGVETFAHYVRTDRSGARPPRPELLELWLSRGWLGPTTPCDCPIQPADLVLDPFAGSGTVGKVALELNRRFVGVELNPAYVGMARRRMSGVQPQLLEAP